LRYQSRCSKRLADAAPSSASLQRAVLVSLYRLVQVVGSGITWALIADSMEDMQRRGVLAWAKWRRRPHWPTRAKTPGWSRR
jgi:hypothetical protein